MTKDRCHFFSRRIARSKEYGAPRSWVVDANTDEDVLPAGPRQETLDQPICGLATRLARLLPCHPAKKDTKRAHKGEMCPQISIVVSIRARPYIGPAAESDGGSVFA